MTQRGWRTARLGDSDVAYTASGGTPDRSTPQNFGGSIPWVKSGELNDGLVGSTEETLTSTGLERSSARIFPRGTLLVALYGATAGKTGILGMDASTNQAVCAIFPQNNSFDSLFLQFQLIHLRPKILNARTGGAQPNISQRVLANLDISLPPLPEQRAIAHVLANVQQAKEARYRELGLERERKAALMEHLFTHGIRGERTKKTEFGSVPESWKVSTLGALCEDHLGILQTGPFGSQLHASDYVETGVPVVNPTHLGFNSIETERVPRVSKELADTLPKHYLLRGDILISRRGDFSRFAYIGDGESGWFCGTGCMLIRLANPAMDNYFLALSMSLNSTQTYLKNAAVGSIMPNLNTTILSQMPVLVPAIEEQRQIAAVISACERKIRVLESDIPVVEELFAAMLAELMSGRMSTEALSKVPSTQ